jgi:hypothetical protein
LFWRQPETAVLVQLTVRCHGMSSTRPDHRTEAQGPIACDAR